GPGPKSDKLPAPAVLFNGHERAHRAEYSAVHLKVPAVEAAVSREDGSPCPERLFQRLEPFLSRLPAIIPDGNRPGARQRKVIETPSARWSHPKTETPLQARHGLKQVEQGRQDLKLEPRRSRLRPGKACQSGVEKRLNERHAGGQAQQRQSPQQRRPDKAHCR